MPAEGGGPLPRVGEDRPGGDREAKYLLPTAAQPPVFAFLAASCRPEARFPAGRVESIYFDTDGLAAYQDKRASQLHKTKIRLRWYDGRGPVFAEVMRRRGERRDKLRALLDLDGEELSRLGLAAPRLAEVPALLAACGQPVPAELRPVFRGRFHRRRWVEPASGVRVALDTAIAAVEVASHLGGGATAGPLPCAVVEIKGAVSGLPAPLRPLLALGCRRASFSKYAACLAGPEAGPDRP